MALKNTFSQSEILETSRFALQNVESNPIIQPLMAAVGYDTAKINEGKALLNTAQTQYDVNRGIDDTKARASKAYDEKRTEIETLFTKDRSKAKLVFVDNATALRELGLVGKTPRTFVKWLESVDLFYNTLNSQPELVTQLNKFQIDTAHVTDALTALATLEQLRGERMQQKGFAQNATKVKDKAFKDLEKWMGAFFAYAKITLADEPQLLESLGKLVRS
ncbi:MAG: hypothetical protein GW772_07215 [Flavobacteriia bacterium]|nr:hypothetical protein [Flavobacteriia bacterium]OIP47830.1 MAG: hypothetical protein AUK46_03305 [Flavobacteriaceae bacterium CG2_30_31_66]PIV97194.1 MAG: hypothetical protein COW43_03995 [Flavobacteriaceae bacterium CG17_big_fil_post_rev_8_21_14_2_50_31_13]PIX13370.1 MAG: hypothetical protein COZ74_06625 [Flavobacteriaceae bacterium CG_4_8_14_3_um_filter_31_8]PIY15868.1 MAG: hypothetical protein COZ16_02285 [Flavobacteriaceae bacterium CG_4_10_14_3_um_filter_31_253]PIZ12263.1 MAG: hypotheti